MITAIIVAGILGLVGSVIGAGVSASVAKKNVQAQKEANSTNVRLNEENNEKSKELQELAYQQNVEQWNRENEYNLPANQMQRFKDAGLNPNLIYSQGSTSASSPTMTYSAPRPSQVAAPNYQNIDLSGIVNALVSIPNMIAQSQLLPYQVASAKNQVEQSTIATKYLAEQIQTDLAFKRLSQQEIVEKIAGLKNNNQSYSARFRTEMDKINAEISSILKRNNLMDSEIIGRNLSNEGLRIANKKSSLELGNYQTLFDTQLHGANLDNLIKEMNLSMMPSVKGKEEVKGKFFKGIYDLITNPLYTIFKSGKSDKQKHKEFNEFWNSYQKMNRPKKYFY